MGQGIPLVRRKYLVNATKHDGLAHLVAAILINEGSQFSILNSEENAMKLSRIYNREQR